MKRIIKAIALVLMAAILVLPSACSNGQDTAQSSTGSRTPVPSWRERPVISSKSPANGDPYHGISESIKGSTVRFATWVDHTATEGAVPLANFEHDTGIKVELFHVKRSGYVNNLMTKMASGDIPDVFVTDDADSCFPLTFNIAAPINKVSTINLNHVLWDKSILDFGTVGGDVYFVNTIGTPWSRFDLVYYNKVVFEENGVKNPKEYYEEGKWTWDNLLKCAADIKALGNDYKGILLDPSVVAKSAKTSFVKYDYKVNTFSSSVNDKNLLKAYEWYSTAREQNLLDGSYQAFESNRCGLIISDSSGLRFNGYFKNMNPEDVGFTYLPTFEEGDTPAIASTFRAYGICDKAPNADAAGYFIYYWLDINNYDLNNTFLTIEAGNFYYEMINHVAEDKYFCFDGAVASLIGKTENDFQSPVKNASADGVKKALDSVSKDVEKAVDAANKLIRDKIIADRNYYK